jgi:GNAT superfamily N-acetyltransferase
MTPISAVRDARPEDAKAATTILSEAFLRGDLAPWLVPLLDDRQRIYPPYFAMLTDHALHHGHVQITDDERGVAVWYSHDDRNIPPIVDYDARLKQITTPYTARFAALDAAMRQHHPHDEPHHYLALLAVHPDRQARGYGSRLLNHHHTELDTDGLGGYLEATGVRNQQLYLRHGYHHLTAYQIARRGPTLYPMWRRPGSPQPAPPRTPPAGGPATHR